MEKIRKNLRFGLPMLLVDLVLFIAGGLVIITQAVIPTDWDACQFVLGMERFCPPDHQPHPPGYFFFILFAKFIRLIFGSRGVGNHTALLLVSALAGALLIPAIRRLAIKLYPGRHDIAIGAAILAIGAPARLFYGAQALSYTWEGLFATLLISLAIDLNSEYRRGKSIIWFIWFSLWAFAVGFRPNLILFFLPLALYLSIRRKWWENLEGIFIFTLITALWVIPTVIASEGFTRYIQSTRCQTSYYLMLGLGSGRLNTNLTNLFNTPESITGLHIIGWGILLIIALIYVGKIKPGIMSSIWHNRIVILLTAIPLIIFHSFIYYILDYSLMYVPILLPVLARVAVIPFEWFGKWLSSNHKSLLHRTGWIIPVLIMAFSYHGFLTGDDQYSIKHIRSLEKQTRHIAEIVRGLGDSNTITVIATTQFRRLGLALSEYEIIHPMRARYPSIMNPRLAAMKNGDTTKGDFFLPGAPESENVRIPLADGNIEQIIVLDENAHKVLTTPMVGWESVIISGSESIYWQRFPVDILLVDSIKGIEIFGLEPE